ncbi:MAG: hypothetical protein QGG40_08165, partial [Myxococcota bacterium]|nr:hypothetical protein [Myxococcota bacterium]
MDDANFLTLAEGAAEDPWRPHDVLINWQGTTERAFDVLSNPPGIAWWLAPMIEQPVQLLHLWMLPWLLLAAWGAWQLGERFCGKGRAAGLLLCASPVALLATHALTPDLPLFACTLAGLGGITREGRRRWPWALLLGCAALFRYSGLALIPLAAVWPALRREWRPALGLAVTAAVPSALLWLHDLHAYGGSHFLAMIDFQSVTHTEHAVFRKLAAALAMLGGAAALPLLCWSRPSRASLGLVFGLGVGLLAAHISEHTGAGWLTTVLACSAGGASLGGGLSWQRREDCFLSTWLIGGLLFLLTLRFTASRYWLPFLAPAILVPLRHCSRTTLAAGATTALSLLLALDDLELARAHRNLADRVASMGTGTFAGHWGWQHYLERQGWLALEEDQAVPPGTLFASAHATWPQEVLKGTCLTPVER